MNLLERRTDGPWWRGFGGAAEMFSSALPKEDCCCCCNYTYYSAAFVPLFSTLILQLFFNAWAAAAAEPLSFFHRSRKINR